jgi:hypothetical protein
MRRLLIAVLAVSMVIVLSGAAFAQMRGPWSAMGGHGPMAMGGHGPMMGPGMGHGTMGQGMMGSRAGQGGESGDWQCPMSGSQGTAAAQVTEERAKELAQQYADNHLKGFTVERVLPFTGPRGTMYSVELKGPDGQARTFHVNPWGNVMPFGGPGRRG